jgi:hypothetical protein
MTWNELKSLYRPAVIVHHLIEDETIASRHGGGWMLSPGAVCSTSRNHDKSSFCLFDTVFHVPDVRGISHMPSEEKLGTVKFELSPASGGIIMDLIRT